MSTFLGLQAHPEQYVYPEIISNPAFMSLDEDVEKVKFKDLDTPFDKINASSDNGAGHTISPTEQEGNLSSSVISNEYNTLNGKDYFKTNLSYGSEFAYEETNIYTNNGILNYDSLVEASSQLEYIVDAGDAGKLNKTAIPFLSYSFEELKKIYGTNSIEYHAANDIELVDYDRTRDDKLSLDINYNSDNSVLKYNETTKELTLDL